MRRNRRRFSKFKTSAMRPSAAASTVGAGGTENELSHEYKSRCFSKRNESPPAIGLACAGNRRSRNRVEGKPAVVEPVETTQHKPAKQPRVSAVERPSHRLHWLNRRRQDDCDLR